MSGTRMKDLLSTVGTNSYEKEDSPVVERSMILD
jgi:hypothetical protein